MQVSVEAPSKLERRLTVVVPVEQLDKAYDKRIQTIAKKAKIDGFRPGKAPLDVIKQRYGDSARQEALSEVIQSSLYEAIDKEKLQPVSQPMVEPKAIAPNQPLEYVATFEVMPEIDAPQFSLTQLEKQIATITDADIEKVITHLRQQHTKWTKVDRAAEDKDQVVLDFRGSIDGIVFPGGEAHDFPLVIGSKSMIPGFEEGVVGMKAGDEKTITVKFPDTYHAKEYAGKTAEFALKAISVSQPELPEIDEDFVKRLGVKSGNAADLQAEIKKNLERELERVIKAKLKKQVFDALVKDNVLDIPKSLIERESQRIHDQMHPHHGHEHAHSEAEMAVFDQMAKQNVILGLLVNAFIKQHSLKVNKDRVKTLTANLASAYENPAEVINWYANNKQAAAELEMQVLEDQVVEKLLENVQVTEKMLTYNELIAAQ